MPFRRRTHIPPATLWLHGIGLLFETVLATCRLTAGQRQSSTEELRRRLAVHACDDGNKGAPTGVAAQEQEPQPLRRAADGGPVLEARQRQVKPQQLLRQGSLLSTLN